MLGFINSAVFFKVAVRVDNKVLCRLKEAYACATVGAPLHLDCIELVARFTLRAYLIYKQGLVDSYGKAAFLKFLKTLNIIEK